MRIVHCWQAIGLAALFCGLTVLTACSDTTSARGPCPEHVDCSKDYHPIGEVQGEQASSPLAGQRVRSSGVVSAVLPGMSGFFIQSAGADKDPPRGLFVYLARDHDALASVHPGDEVVLDGLVSEYHGMTELSHVRDLRVLSSGHAVEPLALSLPLPDGESLERYEGVLVRIVTPMTVAQNYFLARYGQLSLSAEGRPLAPTSLYRPGSEEARQAARRIERDRLVLDDGSSRQSPQPTPFLGGDAPTRAGDRVEGLVGVIDEGLIGANVRGPSGYRLQALQPPRVVHANPRPVDPPQVGPGVRVVGMNVLNFFTHFKGGACGPEQRPEDCRGAHNATEFERQRDKIVAALAALDADAVGLMELENAGDEALGTLVDALNARLGAGHYAVVHVNAALTGHDAIRVGLIFRPQRLQPRGPALTDADPVHSRAPLAQTFVTPQGRAFSLVVAHFKSKRCDGAEGEDADAGDGQACYNHQRVAQSRALLAFIDRVKQAAHDDRVLVIGDFNANPQEDPVVTLTTGGLINEITRHIARPYSFIFDGQSLCIDQVLATPSLDAHVTGVGEWHINADEPAIYDYTTAFKARRYYAPDPYRSSDHDPLLIGLDLGEGLPPPY